MPEFTVFLEEASALAFEPLNRTLDSSHDHDVLMDAQGAKRAVRRFTDMKKLLENLKRKDHAE